MDEAARRRRRGAERPADRCALLDPDAVDPVVAFLVPFVFAFVFFITSQTFGVQIAQSVVEEKQTRIVEILVAAVPVAGAAGRQGARRRHPRVRRRSRSSRLVAVIGLADRATAAVC